MKKHKPPSKAKSEEYDRFEKLAKALIAMPKSETEKRQAEYERTKSTKKRKVA
jgi:hypothetical protein